MKYKINHKNIFASLILMLISISLYRGGAIGPLGAAPQPATPIQSIIGGTILLIMSIICLFTSERRK
jgi:hypothetical protein